MIVICPKLACFFQAAAEGLAAIGSKARCESQEFIAHSHFVRIDGSDGFLVS